ncbi:MAG: RagB/SusD family nutrient uptake outer membrane protein [Odoribacter splanchnicus]
MKKIYGFIWGVLLLSGCHDFLSPDPKGKLTEDLFYSEEEGALMGINAIYARMREWDQEGFPWFVMCELPSDNSNTGSELADGSTARLNTVNNFTYDAGVGEFNNWWTGNYNAIASCNVALDNMRALKDETLKRLCMAQARFFRGFFYFNLVRAFGGVPLVLSVSQPGAYNIPRNTVDEVYTVIINDLKYASANLPTRQQWPSQDLGRVTKGTAQGLLAKVYLFRQNNEQAFIYADSVVQRGEYSLHPNYRQLFSPDSYYSEEVMLADQFLWQDNRDNESQYVMWQGIRGFQGWGFLSPTESLVNSYETADPRLKATVFFSGDSIPGAGVIQFSPQLDPRANHKVIWPVTYWNAGSFTKTNAHLYFLRYADVLLVYAEAANELGKTDEALAKLEEVRKRARESVEAGVDNSTILPEIKERDKVKLREIIWHERRIELALEGHRFFDLIRADRVEPGYAERMLKADNPQTHFTAAKNSVFLIPQTQIDISQGVLKQNQ